MRTVLLVLVVMLVVEKEKGAETTGEERELQKGIEPDPLFPFSGRTRNLHAARPQPYFETPDAPLAIL